MAGLWQWTCGCLAVAWVITTLAWWVSQGSVSFWRRKAQEHYDQIERLRGYLADTLAERNVAQATVADRTEALAELSATAARLQGELEETRGALAQALRRDPTTGRFLRRETSDGRALQH